ncbi:MAG TPA: hypothetical protein VHB97_23575 [Polyangia bacterium]|jgi:hypothetical protein|nr:hypothetical protein [Polyangia bacterium]
MKNNKPTDQLPGLTADQLTEVWGGANRQAALAERERIEEMQRRFVRTEAGGFARALKG